MYWNELTTLKSVSVRVVDRLACLRVLTKNMKSAENILSEVSKPTTGTVAQWLVLHSRPVFRDGFLLAYTMWC